MRCVHAAYGREACECVPRAAVAATGRTITTLEGAGPDGPPNAVAPLQDAFVVHDALQCGFCTPGQIMSAAGYLVEPHVDHSDPPTIREWMSGNLCRCGAYPNIVSAIRDVALDAAGRPRSQS
jgi:xanthine dehydrogenase YagT iron-sulfur-binding subunit